MRTPPPKDQTRRDRDGRRGLSLAAAGVGAPGSLRREAAQLGVSHESVRRAMIAAGEPTDLASRNARVREMAASGARWPEIARVFGMSPAGVRFVCRDLPPRKAGRPWNKTADENRASRDGD